MTVLPIVFYLLEFDGSLSVNHSDWGAFGDYIGGTVGTLFNLAAVMFSFLSIYITLQIATRIHENEQKFNLESINHEKERFKREIELIHKQNKPFPTINFNRFKDKSEIILSNNGPGTLIITQLEVFYEEKVYIDFTHLILEKLLKPEYSKIRILIDSAKKHIINSGGSRCLFSFDDMEIDKGLFSKFNIECRALIEKTTVKFYYEDIFENKYIIEESLEF